MFKKFINAAKDTVGSFLLLTALTVGIAISTPSAHAQKAGVLRLLSGGTSEIPASSTNQYKVDSVSIPFGAPGTASNLVVRVEDFDYVGFSFTATGGAATTNVSVLGYKSMDGGLNYEANPSFSYTGINIGAATYTTNAVWDLHGCTHVAIVLRNAGTGGTTNTCLSLELKSPKFGAKAATQ